MERITMKDTGCLHGVHPKKLGEAIERLYQYEETDLSPDEIHIMSEELTQFHELRLSASDIKEILRHTRAKKPELYKGTYLCPECGYIVGFIDDKGLPNYCEKCGVLLSVRAEKQSTKGTLVLCGTSIKKV